MRRSRLVVCALGFAILWGTAVSLAEDPFGESAGKKPEPARKAAKVAPPVRRTGGEAIEEALKQPIDCDFVETPLKDMVDYFKDVVHIEICLDDSGFKEAGIDEATPVTCNFRGLRFEKVLNFVLDSVRLKWTIHDDVLYITSPTKLESDVLFETRVYDAADLVVYQDENGKKFDDYAPLTDVITATIDAKTWLDNGGEGTIQGQSLGTAKVLVVTHRWDVHKKIAALLAEVRAIAAKKSGDGLPCRERPKGAPTAITGGFRCPGMIPDHSSTKDAASPSKPAETAAQK